MLANAIVAYLDGTGGGLGLSKSTDLFAEQAVGDKYVVIGETVVNGDEIAAVRHANVNVRVVGWGILEASKLAEKVVNKILAMEGGTFAFVNGSLTETYDIASAEVISWPTIYKVAEKVAFTANLKIAYKLATN